MARPKKNTRNYKVIAEKRRAALIAKYGSWEAYQEHWSAKRTATLKAKLGEAGYIEHLKQAGAQGGSAKLGYRAPKTVAATK